jgi:hypothetical protein
MMAESFAALGENGETCCTVHIAQRHHLRRCRRRRRQPHTHYKVVVFFFVVSKYKRNKQHLQMAKTIHQFTIIVGFSQCYTLASSSRFPFQVKSKENMKNLWWNRRDREK